MVRGLSWKTNTCRRTHALRLPTLPFLLLQKVILVSPRLPRSSGWSNMCTLAPAVYPAVITACECCDIIIMYVIGDGDTFSHLVYGNVLSPAARLTSRSIRALYPAQIHCMPL